MPDEAPCSPQQLDQLNQERQAIERQGSRRPKLRSPRCWPAMRPSCWPPVTAGRRALPVSPQRGWSSATTARRWSSASTDGLGKGSGRSVPGFDLGAAVIAARHAGHVDARAAAIRWRQG